ncbi:MAG: cysteine peptidase family C39 domain-containing protein [Acidobacteriales bacterium]|nr:cysteine peptidase family C39 domain-containing protein [Terriglobales bacterium]
MRSSYIAICILLNCEKALPAQEPFIAPAQGLCPAAEAQCGAECLFVALRLLGKEPHYQELLDQAGTDQNGTTVAGLVKAAERQGVFALPLQVSRAKLCEILKTTNQRVVAICHQKPDHFVVWYHNGNRAFSLIDPKYQYPNHLAQPADLENYSGAAILLASESIQAEIATGMETLLFQVVAAVGFASVFAAGLTIGAQLTRSRRLQKQDAGALELTKKT